MSTKMRPLFPWIGVGLAFLVQTAVAVGIGKAASFLPEQLIHHGRRRDVRDRRDHPLPRAARTADADESAQEDEFAAKSDSAAHGLKVVVTSLPGPVRRPVGRPVAMVTISLVAHHDDPVSVFLGAWGALLAVLRLAVIVGRLLLQQYKALGPALRGGPWRCP